LKKEENNLAMANPNSSHSGRCWICLNIKNSTRRSVLGRLNVYGVPGSEKKVLIAGFVLGVNYKHHNLQLLVLSSLRL